jgi:hypothetical protein
MEKERIQLVNSYLSPNLRHLLILNAAGPDAGSLQSEFDPETDNFDGIDWNDEELDRELDEGEDDQNFESASIDSASSKTLSSKTSSKRSFDEVDFEETQEKPNPLDLSPGAFTFFADLVIIVFNSLSDSTKRQKTL